MRRSSKRAQALAAARRAPLGDPDCGICKGTGYAPVGQGRPSPPRPDGSVIVGPPPFGPCSCRRPPTPSPSPAVDPELDRMRLAAGESEEDLRG